MTDRIRLYLDEDSISRTLIAGLRARNVDVLTAKETGTLGASDEVQLALATSRERTLFTFNTRDFVHLHSVSVETGRHHSGIIVSDQLQVGVLLRRLLRLIDGRGQDEMLNQIEFLSSWR